MPDAVDDQGCWQTAFCQEIERLANFLPDRQVSSIFFGGGTPSLMQPAMVGAIIDLVANSWSVSDNIEISLEANPGTVTIGKLADLHEAGINRLSVGVQSLRNQSLRFLSRIHDVAQAITAMEMARNIFSRISIDLIYALPGQEISGWQMELQEALNLEIEHLSLYQLTIEDGTPFGVSHQRGEIRLPDEELVTEMFELTQAMTNAAGLPAYEISNHSVPGAECRHNLLYWQGDDFIGIGPAAHGRITGSDGRTMATIQYETPTQWLSSAMAGNADRQQHCLDPVERMEELVMMGLRLREGISDSLCNSLHQEGLAEMLEENLLICQDGRLRTSHKGKMLLNSVLRKILA